MKFQSAEKLLYLHVIMSALKRIYLVVCSPTAESDVPVRLVLRGSGEDETCVRNLALTHSVFKEGDLFLINDRVGLFFGYYT